jgi:tetratricopeptide (TPR) repeat protein
MKLDLEDRIVPATSSQGSLFMTMAITAVIALVVAFVALPELRDFARQEAYAAASLAGLAPADNGFGAVYKKLGMAPLPSGLAASYKISPNLAKLAEEPCDKQAIFALGEALVANHEERNAVAAYMGFAGACPNGEGDLYRAAQILFQLGDSEKVVATTSELILKSPGVPDYRYLRGRALAGLKRYDDALADYASTIRLQHDPRTLRDGVFTEMANIFLASGRPCEAAATIAAWIALVPATRNTPAVRSMIEEYKAHGCREPTPSSDLNKL